MFTVVLHRIGTSWIDDNRAVNPHRLLHVRMAVIPVSARLLEIELVIESLARLDAGKTDPWNTVHMERKQDAMPVQRRVLIQRIRHRQFDVLAFR